MAKKPERTYALLKRSQKASVLAAAHRDPKNLGRGEKGDVFEGQVWIRAGPRFAELDSHARPDVQRDARWFRKDRSFVDSE